MRQARAQSRHEIGRRYLDDTKLSTGCEWCGERDLEVLDFHHLHDKWFNLSGSACVKPIARLDEEIAKCAVLCANDHRRAHAGTLVIELENDREDHDTSSKPCHFAIGYRIYRPRWHAGS